MTELEETRLLLSDALAENEKLRGLIDELMTARSADKATINELANLVKDYDDYLNTKGSHGEQ